MTAQPSPSATCRHVDCSEEGTRHLEIPMVTPGLPPIRDHYCDMHAAEILGDRMIWPGARDLDRVA